MDETEYLPEPASIADGEILIVDPIELSEMVDAVAFQVRDYVLWALIRKARKWVSIEEALRPASGKLVPITQRGGEG